MGQGVPEPEALGIVQHQAVSSGGMDARGGRRGSGQQRCPVEVLPQQRRRDERMLPVGVELGEAGPHKIGEPCRSPLRPIEEVLDEERQTTAGPLEVRQLRGSERGSEALLGEGRYGRLRKSLQVDDRVARSSRRCVGSVSSGRAVATTSIDVRCN